MNREEESQFFHIPGIALPLRRDFLACIALAVIAIGLYLPTLGAHFVYDASLTVASNDYIHHIRNLADVLTLRILHLDMMDNNRPVYVAGAMLQWAVWGANPAGHHLVSIVLHAAVVLLVFAFCRRLLGGGSLLPPFFAALLFAVHPLNCEAVSEVSYQKDLLVTFFVLSALNLATAFQPVLSRRNVMVGAACVMSLFLAAGSKENGIAGPPALICYWLLFRRDEPRKGWIALCAISTLAVGLFLIARFALPPGESIIFTQKPRYPGGSFNNAMMIQPSITACYFRQIAWPRNLSADYGRYSVRNFDFMASFLMILVISCAKVLLGFQNRVFALGAAIFWLALLPVCNMVPIYRPMADRFLYLPMTGVAIMLASLPWRRGAASAIGAAVMLLAACMLGRATFQREKVWHDSLALWNDSARKNPYSPDAQGGLGSALFHAGKIKESVEPFERSIQLTKGKRAGEFAMLALSLDALGRKTEADAAFRNAAALDARYKHPESLVKALIWEEKDAAKLQVIADRN